MGQVLSGGYPGHVGPHHQRRRDYGTDDASSRCTFGAVAQLGEHLLCKQGVTGSIPVRSISPINSSNQRSNGWALSLAVAHLLARMPRRRDAGRDCTDGATLLSPIME